MQNKISATEAAPEHNEALTQLNYNTVQLCSGNGQWHSPNNKREPKPYNSFTLAELDNMITNPPQVPKQNAQWCIFSELMSREHAEQRQKGRFYALWADIDEPQGMTFKEASSRAVDALSVELMAYASRGATEAEQKARIIVPLSEPVPGDRFVIMQKILNDRLEAAGIKPDRVTERPGQICYLPNRGEFYQYDLNPFDSLLNPNDWAAEIKAEQERMAAAQLDLKRQREQARLKAVQRMASGERSPIAAYNAAYDLELMLNTFGYLKKGDRFVSPLSQTGSAAVIINPENNRWISHHGSDIAAGIGKLSESGSTCSGDAFDLLKFYQHSNDHTAALKAAGDMFTTAEGVSITKQNQRDYMATQAQELAAAEFEHYGDSMANPLEAPAKPKFDFKAFALNGRSTEMRLKMLDDKYVLGRLAILGQATAFYAKPNSGKTLLTIWLLIDAIKNGGINGEDVFYINADDNYKGLVIKLEIAEKYGFNMIAPNENGFETPKFMEYLAELIRSDTAGGKVIILDTLKKFTNIMDKKISTEFGRIMRGFVSKGGTIIMLAHTNKNRSDEGKVVFSGTSDIVDDVDCAYTLDVTGSYDNVKTVLFENIKSRGDVDKEAVYTYQDKASDYMELLNSVQAVADDIIEAAKAMRAADAKLEKNQDAIEAILEAIEAGHILKTELISEAAKASGISAGKIRKALKEHTGDNYSKGHRWKEVKGEKSAKVYKAVTRFGLLENIPHLGYQDAKDPE